MLPTPRAIDGRPKGNGPRPDTLTGLLTYDAERERIMLPTPQASDHKGPTVSVGRVRKDGRARTSGDMDLPEAVSLLQTPTAQLAVNGGSQHPDKRRAGGHGPTLADQAEHELLPTPTVGRSTSTPEEWRARKSSANKGATTNNITDLNVCVSDLLPTPTAQLNAPAEWKPGVAWWLQGRAARNLEGVVTGNTGDVLLPTPVASYSQNTPENHLRKKPGRTSVTDLRIMVENDMMANGGSLLPTPQVADVTGGHKNRSGARSGELLLPGLAEHLGGNRVVDWGKYSRAVLRWQQVLNRMVPHPLQPGSKGNAVLAPVFVEWMLGLPEGWVTGVEGLSRNAQLKILGNGVVPQQAVLALTVLLERLS